MTPLERAQKKIAAELVKLELSTRVISALPKDLGVEPWIIDMDNYKNTPYVKFRVKTLEQVKVLIDKLPLVSGYYNLELSYPCGSFTNNTYKWNWYADSKDLCREVRIEIECAEIVGRVTAVKKIKYYYSPSYRLETDKFNMNEPAHAQMGYFYDRSEYPPSYNLYWDESIFK